MPRTKSRSDSKKKRVSPQGNGESSLDVYVIDSGWDCPAHRVLSQSVEMLKSYVGAHNLYVMSEEQSKALLNKNPAFVGKDPLLVVMDRGVRQRRDRAGFGVALVFGPTDFLEEKVMDPEVFAIRMQRVLRMVCHVIKSHDGKGDIVKAFQEIAYKDGVKGAIRIIMDNVAKKEGLFVG